MYHRFSHARPWSSVSVARRRLVCLDSIGWPYTIRPHVLLHLRGLSHGGGGISSGSFIIAETGFAKRKPRVVKQKKNVILCMCHSEKQHRLQ